MGKFKNLEGQKFNKLTVIKLLGKNEKGKYNYLTRCECGKEKEVIGHYLTNNETKSCGHCAKSESKLKDITGQTFGRLVAIERVGFTEGRNSLWKCKCTVCENGYRVVALDHLRAGDCLYCDECSPLKPKDLTGQTFGKLYVESPVKPDSFAQFHCVCECGKRIIAKNNRLLNGNTKSCGCRNYIHRDYSGQVIGRLTVIRRFEKHNGSWYYLCQCSCGNETLVGSGCLGQQTTKSCGCLSREIASIKGSKLVGKLNPRWRGGVAITDVRKTKEYAQWRKDVLKRDNYCCKLCGDKEELHAHHLNSVTGNEDQITELSNGLTLCKTCHDLFHIEYGYGQNSSQQFIDFIARFGLHINLP